MSFRQTLGNSFHRLGDILSLGYDASESMRQRKDLGWGRSQAIDEDKLISADLTRQLIRQRAADARRNDPIVAGVCDRLPTWIVGDSGILPQPRTSDKGWNKAASEWWIEVYSRACDFRGRSDLHDFQWLNVSLRPTHGGLYYQKIEDGTLRPIECERIRNPSDNKLAQRYTDGILSDPVTGRIKAYRVHVRDSFGGFMGPHPESDVPAEEMICAVRPPWRADQIREVPDLAPVIPALQDVHEMTSYALNTAKVQSAHIGFLKRISGMGLNTLPRSTTSPTTTQRQMFKMDWGDIMEGFPNEDFDMKASPTPNAQHIPFVKMHYAIIAAGLGFPYEFLTLDLAGLDFSRQKGMLLLVNHAVRPWKHWLIEKFLQPVWNWRIAMEMAPGRALSPAPVDAQGISEWAKVDWHPPEELWIDRQQAMQADIMEVQAAQATWSQAAKRRGYDFEKQLEQKADDIDLVNKIAAAHNLDPEDLLMAVIPGQVSETIKSNEDNQSEEAGTPPNDAKKEEDQRAGKPDKKTGVK
jgi:lambda family phage portal protein